MKEEKRTRRPTEEKRTRRPTEEKRTRRPTEKGQNFQSELIRNDEKKAKKAAQAAAKAKAKAEGVMFTSPPQTPSRDGCDLAVLQWDLTPLPLFDRTNTSYDPQTFGAAKAYGYIEGPDDPDDLEI